MAALSYWIQLARKNLSLAKKNWNCVGKNLDLAELELASVPLSLYPSIEGLEALETFLPLAPLLAKGALAYLFLGPTVHVLVDLVLVPNRR